MLVVRQLKQQPYTTVWHAMRRFTQLRTVKSPDEIWLVEHPPVFTQGRVGKAEDLLHPGDIPVIHSDRGGQITYHGPGQQIFYLLIDLKRRKVGMRQFIAMIEESTIATLAYFSLQAYTSQTAPGIYISDQKIASFGLRICRGCSLHGLALNVQMDLSPFKRINPCGQKRLCMTQVADWVPGVALGVVQTCWVDFFVQQLSENTTVIFPWSSRDYV